MALRYNGGFCRLVIRILIINEGTSANHLQVHHFDLTNPQKPPSKERDCVVVQMHCASVTVVLPTQCMMDLAKGLLLGQHSPELSHMIAPLLNILTVTIIDLLLVAQGQEDSAPLQVACSANSYWGTMSEEPVAAWNAAGASTDESDILGSWVNDSQGVLYLGSVAPGPGIAADPERVVAEAC